MKKKKKLKIEKIIDFIFYRAERIGKNGQPFLMWKFRTMVMDADKTGGYSVSNQDRRLLWFGRFLRTTKIDELPNLINLFKGEMSVIGPRPDVKFYIDKLNPEDRKIILSVKPGLVDLATFFNFKEGTDLNGKDDPEKYYEEIIWPKKIKLQIKSIMMMDCFRIKKYFLNVRIAKKD